MRVRISDRRMVEPEVEVMPNGRTRKAPRWLEASVNVVVWALVMVFGWIGVGLMGRGLWELVRFGWRALGLVLGN